MLSIKNICKFQVNLLGLKYLIIIEFILNFSAIPLKKHFKNQQKNNKKFNLAADVILVTFFETNKCHF
jgi:thiamine transporter ThiT